MLVVVARGAPRTRWILAALTCGNPGSAPDGRPGKDWPDSAGRGILDGVSVWICRACGIEHPDTATPPQACAICDDDRQFVPASGQRWTSHAELDGRHHAEFHQLEPDLLGIWVTPAVGIGHRPLLLRTPTGSVLWEPSGYFDDAMLERVQREGPLVAVAASHPHLLGAAVSWARRCEVPLFFNEADRAWLQRPDPVVRFWTDRVELLPGVTLIRAGGHFPGSAVLHWSAGADGNGVLLVGDTLMVAADRATVSFMRSYPNLIPLPERLVRGIAAALRPWRYDRIYGGFHESVISADAQAAVAFSADRYIGWLTDAIRDPDEPSG